MKSITVTLTTAWQKASDLIAAKRTADGLPPIGNNARIKRIIANTGTVHTTRSPQGTNIEQVLAVNTSSPTYELTATDSISPNSFWLKGPAGGELANLVVEW